MCKRMILGILLVAGLLVGPAQGQSLNDQLFTAVKAGDKTTVEALIAKGVDVNAKDEYGFTPLFNTRNREVAELFISKGADVNAKNQFGESPLHKARTKDIAELLIAMGANVNARDKNGGSPLYSAFKSTSMNSDVIELLIAKGADVNAKDNNGNTPLYAAIYPESEAQYHLVEVLITNGADVNTRNNKGETPLQAMDNWNTKGRPCLMSPSYKIDQDCEITKKETVALLQAQIGKRLNRQDVLKTYLEQFKGHSGNDEVRQSIIDLTLKMRPAPAIPAEAEAAAGRGTYIFKNAKSEDEVINAAKEYLAALEVAPWVANYYFNLCTVLEKTPYTQQALHACKLYLVAAPDATDAGAVRQRIAGLQYASDRDKAQMKQRTHYIVADSLEDQARIGGISGTVSGKDVFLKLIIDWTAAPPKYQINAGCIVGAHGVSSHPYDLVTTDSWIRLCNSAINMHLVIKPEGAGFVEVSDSIGGSLRATLDELFSAKQKTMAQAFLFSANYDQGDQFYVPYLQTGNEMKLTGYALYQSDCNGDILKKDPRALPDDFIPEEKLRTGDYGRFTPEVNTFTSMQPKIDVCAQEFASKTGYHFGETE